MPTGVRSSQGLEGRRGRRVRLRLSGPEDLPGLRRELRSVLADCVLDSLIDAQLLLDALATRACRRGNNPCEVRLMWTVDRRHLRVEVDEFRRWMPAEPSTQPRVGVLGKLADAWGVVHDADRNTVWAELKTVPTVKLPVLRLLMSTDGSATGTA